MQSRVQVKAGEAAALGCSVTRGSPRPEIVWSRQVRSRQEVVTRQKQFDDTLKCPLSMCNRITMKSHFLPPVNMVILIQYKPIILT